MWAAAGKVEPDQTLFAVARCYVYTRVKPLQFTLVKACQEKEKNHVSLNPVRELLVVLEKQRKRAVFSLVSYTSNPAISNFSFVDLVVFLNQLARSWSVDTINHSLVSRFV